MKLAPYDDIEDTFYMPEKDGRKWDINLLISGVAYLFRAHKIDRIIALDDYDVWKGARLREEFSNSGMGEIRQGISLINYRCVLSQGCGIAGTRIYGLFNDIRP
jgi:hypothetical protein